MSRRISGMAVVVSVMLACVGPAGAAIQVTEGFDGYALGTHVSAAPPPGPGDFPTLNGPTGWSSPFRSHIGAGLQIEISAGPSGPLFDGAATTQYPTSWWRDRIMDPKIHSNSDGTVTWQGMKVSSAGAGGGAFRVNNQHGGMDYKVLLDGGNNYELRGGHIDTVSDPSGIGASTDISNPDFVLTKIVNIDIGGVKKSTASTWINPSLAGGEAGLGPADMSVTYDPYAGNRNIGEIVLQPGPNIRLDNIVFGQTYADALPDYTWGDPTTGGTWENHTNWTGSPGIPNGASDRAIFPQLPASDTSGGSGDLHTVNVAVAGGKTLRSLIFDGPSRVNVAHTKYELSGDPLTFADGGDITHAAFHTWQASHSQQTVNNDIIMQGDLGINMNWDSLNVNDFRLRGRIFGTGTLTLDNTHSPTGGTQTGRLHLHGDSSSTFSGPVVINGGNVMLYAGSLGDTATGTTINSGSIMGATAEPFTINGPAIFQSYGGNRVYSGNVLINVGGSLELNPGGNQLTASGDISGPGGVTTVSGHPTATIGGHVWITGANTFAGPLTLTERPGGTGGTGVTLNGSMAHSNIIVGLGVTLDGTCTIAFSDGDTIDVDGVFDAEAMQFDLLALTLMPATLVDYTGGTFTIGALPGLDGLLTTPSYDAGWRLTDTGDYIVAGMGAQGDIPEPVTMALTGLALAGLGGYVRRRRRSC